MSSALTVVAKIINAQGESLAAAAQPAPVPVAFPMQAPAANGTVPKES